KHDGDVKLGSPLKYWVKALIVNTQQCARPVANAKPQILPELDAPGAMFHQTVQTRERHLHKISALDAGPVHPAVGEKAIGRGPMKAIQDIESSLASLH